MTRGTGWIEDERHAAAFSAAVLGAVLLPIRQNWREHKRDSFPLSYYPMFSTQRKERVDLLYVVGLTAAGERRLIPYSYAGTGGLNQVRRQLGRLVRGGAGRSSVRGRRPAVGREERRSAGRRRRRSGRSRSLPPRELLRRRQGTVVGAGLRQACGSSKTMSAGPLKVLREYLLVEAPASRLAMLRILTGAWALQYLGRRERMFARVARTDLGLFQPVGLARTLSRPLEPSSFRLLYGTTLAASVAFLGGFRHRWSGPLFSGSLLCLLSYRNSWSMIYHTDNVLVMHALTLGVAPAADAWSLDALASPGSRRSNGRVRPKASWRWGWPIQLMNAVTVLTYFLAGVAKLKGPLGLRWATGESLRSQVAVDGIRKELLGSSAAPLGLRLYERFGIYRVLAAGSLALELGAPMMLVNRRLTQIWAMNAFLMHWGIYFVMGIRFRYQLAGFPFAPFFELERAVRRIARR